MRRTILTTAVFLVVTACASQPGEPAKDDAAAKPETSEGEPTPAANEPAPAANEPEPAAEPAPAPKFTADNITREEAYGKLETGLKEAEVIAAFGEPESKDEEVLQEATGEYIMTFRYPEQGLAIDFLRAENTQEDARSVGGYTIKAPSKLVSRLGIGIGSSRADVEKHYGHLQDAEGMTNDDQFVAGSVYGGEIFSFEDGKVRSVFVGAAAE